MSASAGRSNFLIPNINKSREERTRSAKVNFSSASSVKCPIKAIGINIVIPIAFIGHLTEVSNEKFTFALLVLSALLLLILGIRKFDLPAEADIGDKSVFDFLERQRRLNTTDIETS